MLEDITVIVTSFNRPARLADFLLTARAFYPEVNIVVADNSDDKTSGEVLALCRKWGARAFMLPFNVGISRARNAAISTVKTKYYLLCEDDFSFMDKTDVLKLRSVLETDPTFGLVAGNILYEDGDGEFANRLSLDVEHRHFEVIPISEKEKSWSETQDGVKYYRADYVYNFFLARTDANLTWDDDLKQSVEHIDFAIRMKMDGVWKAGVCPEVKIYHNYGNNTAEYNVFRKSIESWEIFYKKTGWIDGVFVGEGYAHDFKRGRRLSYPEYVFFLLKNTIPTNNGL